MLGALVGPGVGVPVGMDVVGELVGCRGVGGLLGPEVGAVVGEGVPGGPAKV